MSRVFTEEDKQKQAAALREAAKKRQEIRSNKMVIGDYTICKQDELNWTMTATDGRVGYFPSLEGALLSLPKKLTNQLKYKDVAELLHAIKDLNKTIKDFLYLHKKEIVENT